MLDQLELDGSQVLAQHLIESKSLEHQERNYYVTKAGGKSILRLQISKLNRLSSSFQAKERTASYSKRCNFQTN